MSPDDRIRLQHIRDAIQSASRFIHERSKDELDTDQQLQFALIRAVEIVGEAASKISSETRLSVSEIPWQLIISMRNRLVHAYFDVDNRILWNTVTEALPELGLQVETLLKQV